jgi:hypothetical protein
MKEKGVLLIALSLVMLAFVATGFNIQGYFIYEEDKNECEEDLTLKDGTYIIPCVDGELIWEEKQVLDYT